MFRNVVLSKKPLGCPTCKKQLDKAGFALKRSFKPPITRVKKINTPSNEPSLEEKMRAQRLQDEENEIIRVNFLNR